MRPPVHICALLGNPTFPTSKLENSKSRFPGCYSVSCSLVKQRSFRKGQGSEGDTRSTGSDGKRLLPVTAGHWSLPSCRSRFSPPPSPARIGDPSVHSPVLRSIEPGGRPDGGGSDRLPKAIPKQVASSPVPSIRFPPPKSGSRASPDHATCG